MHSFVSKQKETQSVTTRYCQKSKEQSLVFIGKKLTMFSNIAKIPTDNET